jgi:hypothetical protein
MLTAVGQFCRLAVGCALVVTSCSALAPAGAAAAQKAPQSPSEPAVERWRGTDDERPPVAASTSSPRSHDWYGYQTLLADAAGYLFIPLGADSDNPLLLWSLGALTLVAAAPIVHASHDNGDAVEISLTVRLLAGLAVVGGGLLCIAGLLSEESNNPGAAFCVIAIAGMITFPVMTLVDAIGLAHEPRSGGRAHITPWLDPQHRAGGLAYRGSL